MILDKRMGFRILIVKVACVVAMAMQLDKKMTLKSGFINLQKNLVVRLSSLIA